MTLAAAEEFSLSTPLTLKKPTDSDLQKKRSQLLHEEAAVFESDEGNLSEMEDNFDVDMPHRYSKDPKDCKDVTGIFVFPKQSLLNFLFITFCSVLNTC